MSGLSVATIKSPEFINITSINPLISKCEVKVLYVGGNRNHSFITKEVATEMAQTLPGTPIVGYYSEDKEDFLDHGDQLIIDGEGIKFNCLTKPYGFVPTDTKVWFKEFQDTDEFGNSIIREYLMCEGYLWTEQYEEAKKVINEGRPHSMELDENSLKGHWSTDNNSGIEFFIINDSIFSKLCILGEEVEPCFEGSSITAPDVSANFTLDSNEFKKSLFAMMKELKELTYSLQDKGGKSMNDNETNVVEETLEENTQNFTNEEDKNIQEVNNEIQDTTEGNNFTNDETNVEDNQEFAKKDEKDDDTEDKKDNSEDTTDEEGGSKEDDEEEDENKKKPAKNELEEKYNLLEQQYNDLHQQYTELETEITQLKEYKLNIENEKKKEMIDSFYMLSDEDKKEVIDNMSNYSLEEIKSKLSVLYVEKNVSFENNNKKDNDSNAEQQPAWTYNLNEIETETLPEWLKAVEQNKTAN